MALRARGAHPVAAGAVRGGTAFIRTLFVLLVLVLIAKMGWDQFAG